MIRVADGVLVAAGSLDGHSRGMTVIRIGVRVAAPA
jgi:hypothetical protein